MRDDIPDAYFKTESGLKDAHPLLIEDMLKDLVAGHLIQFRINDEWHSAKLIDGRVEIWKDAK